MIAKSRREGNTLAAVLRDAWDGRPLSTMNVGVRSRVVDVHSLAVVGHLTPQTLREKMSAGDLSNGFLNRFFVFLVHRPQLVPWPEPMDATARLRLGTIVDRASTAAEGEYTFTAAAKQVYVDWYVRYSEDAERQNERVAMATARLQANLIRTALIYAALDNTACLIEVGHVRAAIALVANSADSCAQLLAPGKVGLDAKVLAALEANGALSKNDLRDKLNRHVKSVDLDKALKALRDGGLISQSSGEKTGGRRPTVYTAVAR